MIHEIKDWPLVYGKFEVGDKKSCVAVATTSNLHDISIDVTKVCIVGKLSTEIVGIEKLIENTITNPYIRFLIIAGKKNLATQALGALQTYGVDKNKKIINATSKKAQLKNIPQHFIERFRDQVTVVDATDSKAVLAEAIDHCRIKNPGPYEGTPITVEKPKVVIAKRHNTFILDPKGYFLVRVDRHRKKVVVEHIKNGKTTVIILGSTSEEIRETVSPLQLIGDFEQTVEHAMYVAREAYKAELALTFNLPYEQDEPLELKKEGDKSDGKSKQK